MILLAARIAAQMTASIADRQFDIFVRTALLEGAAGVHPQQWTRRGLAGLTEAARHLNLPPDSPWASMRDTGMYGALVRAAKATLGRSNMGDAADDLLSRVLSGETRPNVPGGELYDVGGQLADDIRAGSGLEAARALVIRHLKQRALNDIRGQTRERRRLGPTVQEGVETDEGQVTQLPGSSAYSVDAADEVFSRFLDGPWADQARAWLMDLWSRELRDSDLQVVRAWLAAPGKNFTQLGREIGISGSFIGKAIVRAKEIAVEAVRRNPPPFVREMAMAEETNLSLGVRRASTVSPDDMWVEFPNPRTVRLMVSTPSLSTYFEAPAGPNQVDALVRQLTSRGITVDPDDIETAIEVA